MVTAKSILTLCLLAIMLNINAQINFQEGFIVDTKNDTLRGWIDYRNWDYTPEKIVFKDCNQNIRTLSPPDILQFSVNNELYFSSNIEIEVSNQNINQLSLANKIDTISRSRFVWAIVLGSKSLYSHKDYNSGNENFYINYEGKITLLRYKRYQKGTQWLLSKNKAFLGQLRWYLNYFHYIDFALEKTDYKKESLIKLFQYYYQSKGEIPDYKQQREKEEYDIGLSVGFKITNLLLSGFDHSSSSFLHSYNPTFGINHNYFIPRKNKRWSIFSELNYSMFASKSTDINRINPNYTVTTQNELSFHSMGLTNQIRFNYPISGASFLIGGGIMNSVLIPFENKYTTVSSFYESESNSQGKLFSLKKYQFGLNASSGIKYNKISFILNAELGTNLINSIEKQVETIKFSAVLNFNL